MSLLEAFIYGVLQGLGEFLPISSTAHITLAPWFFGWKDPGLAFDIALHMGTLAAVIIFFWKDWIKLIKAGLTDTKSSDGSCSGTWCWHGARRHTGCFSRSI
jgi:undecaprenyl-diphosphatase